MRIAAVRVGVSKHYFTFYLDRVIVYFTGCCIVLIYVSFLFFFHLRGDVLVWLVIFDSP